VHVLSHIKGGMTSLPRRHAAFYENTIQIPKIMLREGALKEKFISVYNARKVIERAVFKPFSARYCEIMRDITKSFVDMLTLRK
jgi:hypothetical protein